jgi:putative spermidine/putrescine transport system permease protein
VATEELAGGGLQTTTQAAPATTEASGAGTSRSRRFSFAWAGLLPFFVYVFIFFLLPIGVILYSAFRKQVHARDPVTQQFVQSHVYTTANLSATLHGIYRTSMVNSIELSAATAVIGAVFGMFLAYAVVTSHSAALRQIVIAAAAVMANFGGIPLAFLFIATVGFPAGALTVFLQDDLHISLQDNLHFQLTTVTGIALVYLYFLIPLMVLVMSPALEGLKPQWAEAAENLGASRWHYWRYVAGPVLFPNFLGSVLLLFCSAFSAYATADALVGDSFPLIPTQISNVLSGNVLAGQENLGAALAFDMVVIVLPLTVIYQLLQRRTSKWLA